MFKTRLLLRACDREPDAPLDGLRREVLQGEDAGRCCHDSSGPRIHIADLAYSLGVYTS